jgi:hypothetical protein
MDAALELVVVGLVALVGGYVGSHFGLRRRVLINARVPGKPHKHDMHVYGKRKGRVLYHCIEDECGFEQYEEELNG